jgi:hypothetical protein
MNTATTIHVEPGIRLPAAPRGFTWCLADDLPVICCASLTFDLPTKYLYCVPVME